MAEISYIAFIGPLSLSTPSKTHSSEFNSSFPCLLNLQIHNQHIVLFKITQLVPSRNFSFSSAMFFRSIHVRSLTSAVLRRQYHILGACWKFVELSLVVTTLDWGNHTS